MKNNTVPARQNRSAVKPASQAQTQTLSPAAKLPAVDLAPLMKLESAVDATSALLEMFAEKIMELRNEQRLDGQTGGGFCELAEIHIQQLRATVAAVSAALVKPSAPATAHT